MTILYIAHALSTAGRTGHVETDDKALSLNLSKPGTDKKSINPEQLFACGYSACFGSALESVAKEQKVNVEQIKVNAAVTLNKDEKKGYFLSVELEVEIQGVDDLIATELVKKAHQVCPYSKATRNNIEVKLKANKKEIDTSN